MAKRSRQRTIATEDGVRGRERAGQPAFDPAVLLKLYLYGYQHRVRSSRRLEAETRRNLEVIWLCQSASPSYKTIADFRKNNSAALQAVNREFVLVCRELSLLGCRYRNRKRGSPH